ncbi:MAG TPA: hypothetical protein VK750_00745 [Cytophagaceae bacterium]|jgi:hypothetical protein|nr:hypothetical protein [Cytophagaceae bacterium]
MKALFVSLIIVVLGFSNQAKSLCLLGRKAEVVKQYLVQHYPNARYVHQKRITDNLYHVHFIDNEREFFLDITSKGEVIFEETEMMYGELPKMFDEYLNGLDQYEYGVKIETNDGRVFYFLEIRESSGLAEYLFDSKGNMLMRDLI